MVAFVAIGTHLFVLDPRSGGALLDRLLGAHPPMPAVFLTLLVLWDRCYRIGTGWWPAVGGLWRSARYQADAATATRLLRADSTTMLFGALQPVLAPFLLEHGLLLGALGGTSWR